MADAPETLGPSQPTQAPTVTRSPTGAPTMPIPTTVPTTTAGPAASNQPSPVPTRTPEPSTSFPPSAMPSNSPSTSEPTSTPMPTETESATPTFAPSTTPGPTDTQAPSPAPSPDPSTNPTQTRRPSPTPSVSVQPSTNEPSASPSFDPSWAPSTTRPSSSPTITVTDEGRMTIEMLISGIAFEDVVTKEWQDVTSEHVKSYWNLLPSLDVLVEAVVTNLTGLNDVAEDTVRRRALLSPTLSFLYSQNISYGLVDDMSAPEEIDSLFTRPFRQEAQSYLNELREITGTQGDIAFRSIVILDSRPPSPTPSPTVAPSSDDDNTSLVVGLTVGLLAGIVVLFGVVWYITRRPREPLAEEFGSKEDSLDSGPVVIDSPGFDVSETELPYTVSGKNEPIVPVHVFPPQSEPPPRSGSPSGTPVEALEEDLRGPPLLASGLEEVENNLSISSSDGSEPVSEEEVTSMSGFHMEIQDIEDD